MVAFIKKIHAGREPTRAHGPRLHYEINGRDLKSGNVDAALARRGAAAATNGSTARANRDVVGRRPRPLTSDLIFLS